MDKQSRDGHDRARIVPEISWKRSEWSRSGSNRVRNQFEPFRVVMIKAGPSPKSGGNSKLRQDVVFLPGRLLVHQFVIVSIKLF
ncbi:hypothetical protein J8TS2_03530 [Lederbergia ruris]|uniref:Uncharacterized protein n=1 Tax=Lederbergia ruris TaxID=217495 RepID=A0ABQ4KG07_9BACI|nr:hypothetical protein J8TS2_03530 [Lederbergia ruris]